MYFKIVPENKLTKAKTEEKNLVAGDKIGNTQSAVVLEKLISKFLYNMAADPAPGAAAGK
jgi:phospholipid/cholesterol/gamma-HCH transport system substrate-binding protein